METISQKRCSTCGETKLIKEFGKRKTAKNGYRSQCKKCEQTYYQTNKEKRSTQSKCLYRANLNKINERHKAWYLAHKEDFSKYSKEWYANNSEAHREKQLKRLYGITVSKKNKMLQKQNGKCLICGTDKPEGRGFVVDHDHKTGIIRGVLCFKCNIGLGNFRDNIGFLQSAIDYLKREL